MSETSSETRDVDGRAGHSRGDQPEDVGRQAGSADPAARLSGRGYVNGPVQHRKRTAGRPLEHLSECSSRLRGEWDGSRSRERRRERGEDAEVGVQLDAVKRAHAERLQPVLILEPPEGPLDGSASAVEVAEPLRVARDQRVQPGCLPPDRAW